MFSPTYIKSAREMFENIHKTVVNTAIRCGYKVEYGQGYGFEPILKLIKKKRMFELYVVTRKFEIVMMSKVPATEKIISNYRVKKRKAKAKDYKFEFEIYDKQTLGFAKYLINKVK